MLILDLNETMDLLSMTYNVNKYGDVLRKEDGHFFRSALAFVSDGKR